MNSESPQLIKRSSTKNGVVFQTFSAGTVIYERFNQYQNLKIKQFKNHTEIELVTRSLCSAFLNCCLINDNLEGSPFPSRNLASQKEGRLSCD